MGKDFEAIELRAGLIIKLDDLAQALGAAERPIPGVVVFPRRQLSNLFTEVLTTGFYLPPGEVVIVHPERKVPNEAKLG